MKYWKCKFEAQKGHPNYNSPSFEREKIVVVQSKFKGEAREHAEDALLIWDNVAPEKYRVPIIEQATDLEADQYQRKLTAALHSTEQTGGEVNSSGQATESNTIVLDVHDFPVCDPYSVYVGIHHDQNHDDYRHSMMLIDRATNKTLEGNLAYLSDTAYASVNDAINQALTKAIDVIEQVYGELFGPTLKPSLQILKGYRTLSEKQQVDQYLHSIEIDVTNVAQEDESNESLADPDVQDKKTGSDEVVADITQSMEKEDMQEAVPPVHEVKQGGEESNTTESRIHTAVQTCITKHLNKVPCPTVEDCTKNLLSIIQLVGESTVNIDALCQYIKEDLKNPFVMLHSTVSLNLIQGFQDKSTPDPVSPVIEAVESNTSSPQVPKDFDLKVYQNLKELSALHDLPVDELCDHILKMDDISELYDFGRCEELVGLYVKNRTEKKEETPDSITRFKDDFDRAVAELNAELDALEVGQTIYKDDLPSKVYHTVVGISSTNLKEELISSEYRHNLKNGVIERPNEHHFSFGNYVHTLLLQPELVESEYCFERELPDNGYTTADTMKSAIDKYNKDNGMKLALSGTKKDLAERIRSFNPDAVFKHELDKVWQDEQESGLIPVSLEDKERAARIVQSAMKNPAIRNWYTVNSANTKCERSYFTKIKIDHEGQRVELILKARLDKEIGAFIIDTKTIDMWRDIKEEDAESHLNREIEKRGYHLSAAHYLAVTGKTRFYWIFHNKLKGYEWEVIMEASEDHLTLGRFDRDKALHSIAQSILTGHYPPPVRQPLTPDGKPTPLMSKITNYGFRRLEAYQMDEMEHAQGGYHE